MIMINDYDDDGDVDDDVIMINDDDDDGADDVIMMNGDDDDGAGPHCSKAGCTAPLTGL